MSKSIFLWVTALVFLVTSCKTKERTSELNYMQTLEQTATAASINSASSTIQPGDQLVIFVSAKDMEVVKPFNQNYYSSQSAVTSTATNSNSLEKGYMVDSVGNIDFPVLGTISTAGKSVEEVKRELTEGVSKYVKSPNVTVRLGNFKVTVLGEVARPGQYSLPEASPSVLTALGAAGDLTMYGKRDDLLLVRNENGQITKAKINLMAGDFTSNPYFQLKQNDVIYVSSNENKDKIARQDPNNGLYIAVAGMVIGLAGIFITIFKK